MRAWQERTLARRCGLCSRLAAGWLSAATVGQEGSVGVIDLSFDR